MALYGKIICKLYNSLINDIIFSEKGSAHVETTLQSV